ncbi:MAG: hypothetical protein WDZ54_02135 [Sneathiella sp.]
MFRKQLNFRFTGDQIKALDHLQESLHTETYSEALRKGINLANAVVVANNEGYTIIFEKKGEKSYILKIS